MQDRLSLLGAGRERGRDAEETTRRRAQLGALEAKGGQTQETVRENTLILMSVLIESLAGYKNPSRKPN